MNQVADTASAQHDTVSSGASNVGASSSVSGAVRQVQVFELGGEPCDVASWFAGGHVRAVTCADASLKPRTIQCPTGVETLASPSVACVDVECLSSPGFECVAALSIVLSKLEARDDPVPTGGPLCDVCSVSECHHNDLCCIVECPRQDLKGESQGPSSAEAESRVFPEKPTIQPGAAESRVLPAKPTIPPEAPQLRAQQESLHLSLSEQGGPETFDMSQSDAKGLWSYSADVHSLSWDPCMESSCFVCAVQSLDTVPSEAEMTDVILDSGADVSCLPLSYGQYGSSHGSASLGLRDAQGESLAVQDLREVSFIVHDETGEPVIWKEVCAIAPVTQPLLCKGKLMRSGWWPKREPYMCMEHESGVKVPMSFRGNSLCVRASIFRVGGQEVTPPPPENNHVRFVQAQVDASRAEATYGWQMTEQGQMLYRGRGKHFVDPSLVAPVGCWPCRTTLVKPCRTGQTEWLLLEFCRAWGELGDPVAELPNGECEIICMLSSGHEAPEDMKFVPNRRLDHFINWSGLQPYVEPDPEGSDYEMSELGPDDAEPGAVSVGPSIEPIPDVEVIPVESEEARGGRSTLVFDGVELSLQSTLSVIRAACKSAGVSVSGSKQRCLDRLRGYIDKQNIALRSEVAQTVESEGMRVAEGQRLIKEPSEAERRLHELTHWPYMPWCSHCLSMRGLEDKHVKIPLSPDRATPVVSFDYCYTGVSSEQPSGHERKLTVLVAHDTGTGSLLGLPVASKGKEDLRFTAVELTRFIQNLGHNSVCLQTDNEPSTLALQDLIVGVRTRLGFQTLIRNAPVDSHASKGHVEKAVDLIRGLSNVLLDQVRARYDLAAEAIGPEHPLMAWSYVHASYILNRFGVHGGATAFERCTGYRFSGKLAMFGEPVWGFRRGKAKGDRKWHRAVFLTKTTSNDMHVLMSAQGVWTTRSIRRNAKPWVEEKNLVLEGKGFPWNYQLGVLGSKTFPQPKHRVAKPAEEAKPVFEQSASVEPMPDAPRASDMPSMAGMPALNPVPASVPESAPASRKTLLLDRPERVPQSVLPDLPRPANASPMDVAGSDPSSSSSSSSPSSLEGSARPAADAEMVNDVAKRVQEAEQASAEAPGGQAHKYQRVARIGASEYPINDELLESAPEWEDAAVYMDMSDEVNAEWDVHGKDDVEALDSEARLWFDEIPDLSEQDLSELDFLADGFEVERLKRMKVIEEVALDFDTSDHKELSSKFVRTWRKKKRCGREMFFRRSRLVAREYRWLERDKEGLYAPATSSITTKVLPWLYCELKRRRDESGACDYESQVGILALDIKDAFLCVPQEKPMLAKLPGFEGTKMRFLRMIPGQRDGTARWHGFIMKYIGERHKLEACAECPSVYKILDGAGRSNPGVIHVDDLCLVGFVKWLKEQLLPSIEENFEVSYELAVNPGDIFKFLKREHVLLEDGVLVKPLADHAVNMCQLLEVRSGRKVPTPSVKELLVPDDSKVLSVDKAARFRSAVGIAMYVSQDRADIAFTVRVLSQRLKNPTEKSWAAAQRLASYLDCTSNYASKVHASSDRRSILEPTCVSSMQSHDVLLEVYCDADWSGNKQNRRSMSSGTYLLNTCCVHTSCRSQRCVSLSSTESEFYALVSAACDGIFLKRILEFLLQQEVMLVMRTDNQSCRQIALKRGVSKVRHLDGRFLWVQEKVSDGTLQVKSVDGRRNPGDLGTKVPTSGTRLKALLRMHDFVECIGDNVVPVGEDEHDALVRTVDNGMETARVRRLVCKTLKTNGFRNSLNGAMMVMLLSLVSGAEAATRVSVGIQAEMMGGGIRHVWIVAFGVCVALLLTLVSLERLRSRCDGCASENFEATCAVPLDPSITTTTTSSIDVPEHETTWAEFFKLNILWIMLMMYLGYAQWMLQRANQEIRRLRNAPLGDVVSQKDASTTMNINVRMPTEVPRLATTVPNRVVVTPAGRCYHHASCHTTRDSNIRTLHPCAECRNRFG